MFDVWSKYFLFVVLHNGFHLLFSHLGLQITMEKMELFDQETALPFGDEFILTLSPLGDEVSTEQYESQEQEDERVSSPSLYSSFAGFPHKTTGELF